MPREPKKYPNKVHLSQSGHRSKGRRFTIEQQQEYRSRAQFDDRISEFGWVVNTKERDHGEDLLVDIYDAGRSSGISFLAQLKSTDDVERFVPKKDKTKLSYRFDVDDLEHWEVAAHLIVVVVWDVGTKSGVWLTVPEIIKQLDRKEGWRKQVSVTVGLPCSNGMDDASLHRLRHLVADRNYPIVKQGKTFQIASKVSFPNTPEGREAAAAIKATLDHGEPSRIEGRFIKSWKMSDWWERLYGPALPQSSLLPRPPIRPISLFVSKLTHLRECTPFPLNCVA